MAAGGAEGGGVDFLYLAFLYFYSHAIKIERGQRDTKRALLSTVTKAADTRRIEDLKNLFQVSYNTGKYKILKFKI